MLEYLNVWDLLPPLQSVYQANHSTETAVFKVLQDILLAVDAGDIGLPVLALLDLRRLPSIQLIFCCREDAVRGWFQYYLTGRFHSVRRGSTHSQSVVLRYGVPQESVLYSITLHAVNR